MSELYNVSSSPHVRSKDTTSRIMLYVIIALLPTSIFGIYNFGYKALVLILVTIASCVVSEWIYNKIVHKKNTITDLSAVVTGLLLALNLPATPTLVAGGNRRRVCDHCRKMSVWRTWAELYEPCAGGKMFSADRVCCRYDEFYN